VDELSRIKAPTLLMAGQYDPFANRQQIVALHSAIVGSEFCILPGVAHSVITQQPQISALIILDYLRRQRKKRNGQN
jgi:pimeloyl-ACP methyl ester carboxylesterase